MEEKGKEASKEIAALSVLFLSSCFNLAMTGKPVFILPIGLSMMLFLFVLGRNKAMLIIAGYTSAITVVLVYQKVTILGTGMAMGEISRYILLGVSFIFLAISFFRFVKGGDHVNMLAFFGFLYLCVDLLLATGFRLSSGLFYHPVMVLIMISPLIGLMLKTEEKRA